MQSYLSKQLSGQPVPRAKLYTIPTFGSPIRQRDGTPQKLHQGNSGLSASLLTRSNREHARLRSKNGLAMNEAVSQSLISNCRRRGLTLGATDWPDFAKLQDICGTDAVGVFIV